MLTRSFPVSSSKSFYGKHICTDVEFDCAGIRTPVQSCIVVTKRDGHSFKYKCSTLMWSDVQTVIHGLRG